MSSTCNYPGCYIESLPYSKDNHCIFHEFEKTSEDIIKFQEMIDKKIDKNDFDFVGYVFPEGFYFKKYLFSGSALFANTIFRGAISFEFMRFAELAYFYNAIFLDEVSFLGSMFFGEVVFDNSKYVKNINFHNTKYKDHVYAYEMKFKKRPIRVELLYRAAKTSAYMEGDYIGQGYYHQKEMDAIRQGQNLALRSWNFIFQKLLHGYGEKPVRVGVFSFCIIILFSILFSQLGINQNDHTDLVYDYLTCLYYSVVTFTTLGYGDFHPIGWGRLIASVEALLGVFLMALFVVTFAKKWRR